MNFPVGFVVFFIISLASEERIPKRLKQVSIVGMPGSAIVIPGNSKRGYPQVNLVLCHKCGVGLTLQRSRVGNSTFCSSLFHSCHSFVLPSFTLDALLKRATGAIYSYCSMQKEIKQRKAKARKSEEQKSEKEICSFLDWASKRKLQIYSFHPAFPFFMLKTKEQIALVAICQKSDFL